MYFLHVVFFFLWGFKVSREGYIVHEVLIEHLFQRYDKIIKTLVYRMYSIFRTKYEFKRDIVYCNVL